jgi:hypothetical protein
MEEEWKVIKEYPMYEISSLGRVRSYFKPGGGTRTVPKLLCNKIDRVGYSFIHLKNDNGRKPLRIHRLVAEAFLPNPNNLPVVNHKDENKLNNNVDNLEWCTEQYNNNYGACRKKHSKKISKPVIMCDKETMQTEVYDKVKDVKNRFYNAKTQDEWNQIKEEYKIVMAKAKELMTPEFYEKYNKGVQDAIAKIYGYKEKQFNKAKVFTPKVTYLLQDDLAQALTKYIQLKTIGLSMELEAKKAISDARNYC